MKPNQGRKKCEREREKERKRKKKKKKVRTLYIQGEKKVIVITLCLLL